MYRDTISYVELLAHSMTLRASPSVLGNMMVINYVGKNLPKRLNTPTARK